MRAEDNAHREKLAQALAALGCPPDKTPILAEQLAKRADQLSRQTGRSYEEALVHLLNLMRQGWAAQAAASGQPPSHD